MLPLACLPLIVLVGCAGDQARRPKTDPAVVSISQVGEQEVPDYEDFTGRTEAKERVEVKARATGYLEQVMFKDGDVVKQGDQLYQIDDRTYKANLDKLNSDIERNTALKDRLNSDLARARRLRVGETISREEYDKTVANRDEAQASLQASKAAAKVAELNLSFTKVLAPIAGKVSKTRITKGNLVTQDQTLLTTIVALNPMYAYFDVDERSVLRIRAKIRQKEVKSAAEAKFPVVIGLMTEKGFPHKGIIHFVDNRLDPNTGTLRVGGTFENPGNDPVLLDGLFVRVRVAIGAPLSLWWSARRRSAAIRVSASSTSSTTRTRSNTAPLRSAHSVTGCVSSTPGSAPASGSS